VILGNHIPKIPFSKTVVTMSHATKKIPHKNVLQLHGPSREERQTQDLQSYVFESKGRPMKELHNVQVIHLRSRNDDQADADKKNTPPDCVAYADLVGFGGDVYFEPTVVDG